ncbi:sigma-70 family RNA polymerase sigma factor [Akkermansiaceae bacterium]|nr:sigma-70 family RNA polymerase sigma factor [Akkermansiaceae bacterium]
MEPRTSSSAARSLDGAIAVLSPSKKPRTMEEKPTLRQVFDAEESPLLRYAHGLTGQRETAEDIVQDAFMRLHEHWHEVESPRPWLFRCVRNLALNHLRDNKRNTSLETSNEWESDKPDPEATLGKLETIGTLQLLIAELPEPDRTLVSLKYLSGLRYDEIAAQTNLTVSNVGYKLHHTLKSLATSLRHLGIETAEG